MSERAHLLTEQINPNSINLDQLDTPALVELFCDEDALVVPAVRTARLAIAQAIDRVALALGRGHRLFYIGAGTSGRLGVLDASECPPTFCTAPEQVQGIIAGGVSALTRSVEGAEDDPLAGAADLAARHLEAGDVVVGISAGGTAPYVLGALGYARQVSAATVFVACVPTEQIPAQWDIEIRVPVGAEILAGSTRLKAGTATKLVLNMLSTGAMVRLGKTCGNLMVDVAVTNQKLYDRAARILTTLTELERAQAIQLLEASGRRVKVALLMHWSGQRAELCAEVLSANGGLLPVALQRLQQR
ncbi:N-acetylmuramic acid 6-phosphate etherase [Gloeobacter kilaueensis]|uniref:N-acetylmuramic acid 6-phosphate etherase n=1 Tax=Gloeobacter kilaueensis (strain ATCC BAA-2537 / CCAP 1431/1 / ULC 316 / JS1) TaxID=1183438 RepID=U5QJ22_GLOK1|nr:N-acetylmuramic acid-6-phosphate etherase [Gloeobacter kilaueensis JS1]